MTVAVRVGDGVHDSGMTEQVMAWMAAAWQISGSQGMTVGDRGRNSTGAEEVARHGKVRDDRIRHAAASMMSVCGLTAKGD